MQGFKGELVRAFAHGWGRTRIVVQLALVAVLVGTPYRTFVGDRWTTPEPQDLVAPDHPVDPPMPTAAPTGGAEIVARAAPPARGAVPTPVAAAVPATAVHGAPPAGGRYVVASWYGPGFYGNRTACGQTFTAATWGVAHKTLPCGTMISVTYGGRTVAAPVIDRGPYVAGREVDLAAAVADALGFRGVQQIYLVIP